MNRIITASFILIISISIGICALAYIEKNCTDLINEIDESITTISQEEYEKTTKQLTHIVEKWEQKRPILNLILGQGEVNEIRGNLNKSIFFFNTGDYSTALLHLQECKTSLNIIITTNEPTLSTIL